MALSMVERSTQRVFCKRDDGSHDEWCGALVKDAPRSAWPQWALDAVQPAPFVTVVHSERANLSAPFCHSCRWFDVYQDHGAAHAAKDAHVCP